jgi:hypothetical protein
MDTIKIKRFVVFSEILVGIIAGLCIYVREWWILIVLLPLGIYIHKNKPSDKEEEELRQDLSNKAFAFGLILPAGIFLVIFLYLLFFKLVPTIIHHWQG